MMIRRLSILIVLSSVTLAAVSYVKQEQVTVANASIGFTAANINNTNGSHVAAVSAVCRLETAEIRYTLDGTAPTTSVGILMEIGDVLSIAGNDLLNNFRAIRTGSTSGQLDCTYYGSL